MSARDLIQSRNNSSSVVEQQLETARNRFISENTAGYVDATGRAHEPVSDTEARRRWALIEGRVRSSIEDTLAEAEEHDRPTFGGPRDLRGPRDFRPSMRRGSDSGMEVAGPRGMFNPREVSQLKDIIILMLAEIMQSDLDKGIAENLMAGKDPDPGQLQHILDEARRLKLPESHTGILQKIHQKLSAPDQSGL